MSNSVQFPGFVEPFPLLTERPPSRADISAAALLHVAAEHLPELGVLGGALQRRPAGSRGPALHDRYGHAETGAGQDTPGPREGRSVTARRGRWPNGAASVAGQCVRGEMKDWVAYFL